MPDVRSEIRDAFARRLARAPMSPDLPERVSQRVAGRGQLRRQLRLATAVTVLLAVAAVGTLLYVVASRRPQSQPATDRRSAYSPRRPPPKSKP